MKKLLIANRGEIAIRIARTASDMGIATVGVYSDDDALSLHVRAVDEAANLGKTGAPAYLDVARVLEIAAETACDAVHPGYGFLSESAAFCRACEAQGLIYVGPSPEALEVFGDKAQARALAARCSVPLLPGISHAISFEEASDFFQGLGEGRSVMLKAVAGGGGRGMRPVTRLEDLKSAFERCASEALQFFGSDDVYIEELFPRARHIEVQIVGDGAGAVSHLWNRECSLQRQRQKIVEIAPAFGMPEATREAMLKAAVELGHAAGYRGVGTIEFLLDARPGADGAFVFIEANARLQVEHTVTEEVLGFDLVRAQLRIAGGARLAELGLLQDDIRAPRGTAVQVRINLETMTAQGTYRPSGGLLTSYDPPSGPGVRVDGFGYAGYQTSTRFDSLLAKLIVHGDDLPTAVNRCRRALGEFKIVGTRTNISFLSALLASPALSAGELHTRYVEEHAAELLAQDADRARYFEPPPPAEPAPAAPAAAAPEVARAGAAIDPNDPLAVLSLRPGAARPAAAGATPARQPAAQGPQGTQAITAPIQGTVIQISAQVGDRVRLGQPIAVMEALKMEHIIAADVSGVVRQVALPVGAAVFEGAPLLFIEPAEVEGGAFAGAAEIDLDAIRGDVAQVKHFHQLTTDAARSEATAKRHAQGKRTARENILDLCEPGSFLEYGPIVTASRLRGESLEAIEHRVLTTAADGMVMGVGRVNTDLVGAERARAVVMSYDYSVLAGTQGGKNHQKTDRMLEVSARYRLPVVFFTEGGGGRTGGARPPPGTRPATGPFAFTGNGGLKVGTWHVLGKLSGLVPLLGVTSGRCFAGNAVILALCDVIIATRDSTIGIGGPAMIEGGGLGAYAPEEVGPVSIQEPNGVIDVVVEDEAEATRVAAHYLSFFQGRVEQWTAPDQRLLRQAVPENRRAVYDVRKIIETLADEGSMLELRRRFGVAMVTALIRVEGRPLGVVANNSNSPTGGAVDSDAADKAARFMQLCDAFDIPILSMIDTPGNMVGPEAEKTALIRHCGRLYVTGANVTVPIFAVVLRKAYGLGALAMSGGGFDIPFFTVSWPTGEFAGMGLEGQIKLGRRAELEAITDIGERKARYDRLVAEAYEAASALNGATVFEFDDVIDPADTRRWIAQGLASAPAAPVRTGKKRDWIDTW
jgi:acetyl/propionyl-CoA carboxylase alpha subunit/acetyl-CoA carboxylase carboxyltransferase component